MSSRHDRRERFAAIVGEPEALELMCDRIADGETIADIARGFDANYRWVFAWFHDEDHPERLQALQVAEQARDSLTKDDVITQLHRLSTLDIRRAFDKNGEMLRIEDMPEDIAKAIASIDVTVDENGKETKKLRFVDRGQMIALSGRKHRMFIDRVENTGMMTLEQAVSAAVKGPTNE